MLTLLGAALYRYVADLVVVRGDPTTDIGLLETGVVAVVKSGKLVIM
jgi:hypothetical protein